MSKVSLLGHDFSLANAPSTITENVFSVFVDATSELVYLNANQTAFIASVEDLLSMPNAHVHLSESWKEAVRGAAYSDSNLFFLKQIVIPLAKIKSKNIDSLESAVIKLIDERGRLYREKEHTDVLVNFYDTHRSEITDICIPLVRVEPFAADRRTFSGVLTQLPTYSAGLPLDEKLKTLETYFNSTLKNENKDISKDKGPKWWQSVKRWFGSLGSWLWWGVKGALALSLLAAVAYVSIQGATALAVGLVVLAGVSVFTTFLWPYCVKFYNWLTGNSVLNDVKTSELSHLLIKNSITFAQNSLLTRPPSLQDRDFLSLGQQYSVLLKSLTAFEQGLSSPFALKNYWFRRKAYKALVEIKAKVSSLKEILEKGIEINCEYINSTIEAAIFDSSRLLLDEKSDLAVDRLKHYMNRYASEEQKITFDTKTNFCQQLAARLGSHFLSQPENIHTILADRIGLLKPNAAAMSTFMAAVTFYIDEPKRSAFNELINMLNADSIIDPDLINERVYIISDNQEEREALSHAVSNYILKSVSLFRPRAIELLTQQQREHICELYLDIDERLHSAIERFVRAVQSPEYTFNDNIAELIEMLNISDLYANISLNLPSLKSRFQDTLKDMVVAYDGRPLRAIHLDVLNCLPKDDQQEARQSICSQRLLCLLDESSDNEEVDVSREDIVFMVHPSIELGKTFWARVDELELSSHKISSFVRAAISAGILPLSTFFAFEYMVSLGSNAPLKALTLSDGSENQMTSWHNEFNELVVEHLPNIVDSRTPADIQQAFHSLVPQIAQLELLVHLNPLAAINFYIGLPVVETEARSGQRTQIGSGFLARLSSLSSLQLMPVIGAREMQPRVLPTGSMETVSDEAFSLMCHEPQQGAIFRFRAIRDPRWFPHFNRIRHELYKHPRLLLEFIISGYRNLEFSPRQISPKLVDYLYDLLDTHNKTNYEQCCLHLGERLLSAPHSTLNMLEILELTRPLPTPDQEFRTLPSAENATRILAYTPRRLESFWIVLSNYPQGTSVRSFVSNRLKEIAETGQFYSENERSGTQATLCNMVGIHFYIPQDLLETMSVLNIFYPVRSNVKQRLFRDTVNFRGFFTRRGPLARRISSIIGHLEYNEGMYAVINRIFSHVDLLDQNRLRYIEQSDHPKHIKALYLRNVLYGRLDRFDGLQDQRERFYGELESNEIGPDHGLSYYFNYCRPERVLNVVTEERFLAEREQSFRNKL